MTEQPTHVKGQGSLIVLQLQVGSAQGQIWHRPNGTISTTTQIRQRSNAFTIEGGGVDRKQEG